jgi:hypothetical protein
MPIASIGRTVVIVDEAGDFPAIVSRVITGELVNLVAFGDQEITFPKYVKLHIDRETALKAFQKDGQVHAYWPARL